MYIAKKENQHTSQPFDRLFNPTPSIRGVPKNVHISNHDEIAKCPSSDTNRADKKKYIKTCSPILSRDKDIKEVLFTNDIQEMDNTMSQTPSTTSTASTPSVSPLNTEAEPAPTKPEWPALTIGNINTTFKVIGDLKEGSKVKIIDTRYLAEDNTYFCSFSRYKEGQGREQIMSFLDHLYHETKRNVKELIANIRNNIDVDDNVSELENTMSNMMIFLHRYDVMRAVYRDDTGTHARLGVIRNEFFKFRHSLFRDLAISR